MRAYIFVEERERDRERERDLRLRRLRAPTCGRPPSARAWTAQANLPPFKLTSVAQPVTHAAWQPDSESRSTARPPAHAVPDRRSAVKAPLMRFAAAGRRFTLAALVWRLQVLELSPVDGRTQFKLTNLKPAPGRLRLLDFDHVEMVDGREMHISANCTPDFDCIQFFL